MKLDVKSIKELSKNLEKYGLEEMTLENEGTKITLRREIEKEVVVQQVVAAAPQQVIVNQEKSVEKASIKKEEVVETESIKSPMVGTYYGSPSPEAELFVKEGTVVEAGDTVCIVEAMKLMNEVKADKRCKILKVLLKDGDAVTKAADLFLIEEA